MPKKIAVIGAGWAGCAAAVALADHGDQVTIFDAARMPGGRARKVQINGLELDNGQHILMGAYSQTLHLMQKVGINLSASLLRVPMQMRYPGNSGMDFVAASLPAPLHLVVGLMRATGLRLTDKAALVSFAANAAKINWNIAPDFSVSRLLKQFKQTDRLIQLMWRPLCLAALNTPPEIACAQTFLNVLKDSLGGSQIASQMLLPRVDMSALFPQKAIDYVVARGGVAAFGKRINAVTSIGSAWQLNAAQAPYPSLFNQVVIATDLQSAGQLLKPLSGIALMPTVSYQSITTCYVQFPSDYRLNAVFYALVDDPKNKQWGQFVFDRGQLNTRQQGLFAVVISASGEVTALGHDEIITDICQQLAAVFKRDEFTTPLWAKVITEKRATFGCVPELHRPPNSTQIEDIALAGDFTVSRYPATLEAAVRSGYAAATELIKA